MPTSVLFRGCNSAKNHWDDPQKNEGFFLSSIVYQVNIVEHQVIFAEYRFKVVEYRVKLVEYPVKIIEY